MAFHPVELLFEWETRANRPRPRPELGEQILERWSVLPGSTAVAPLERPPDLMIILTTFARPAAAARLLSDLSVAIDRAGLGDRSALLVLHDACGRDYAAARRVAEGTAPERLWLDAREWFGKPEFWKIDQTALLVARAWQPRLALYLQDDVEFDGGVIADALALWQATERDLLRRVLYLFSSRDDEASGRWVHFERQDAGPCRLTNWSICRHSSSTVPSSSCSTIAWFRSTRTAGVGGPGNRAGSAASSRAACSGERTSTNRGRRSSFMGHHRVP